MSFKQINPLPPIGPRWDRLAKILISIWEEIITKFPMSDVGRRIPYESVDERAYLRLCPEKRRKKEFGR